MGNRISLLSQRFGRLRVMSEVFERRDDRYE